MPIETTKTWSGALADVTTKKFPYKSPELVQLINASKVGGKRLDPKSNASSYKKLCARLDKIQQAVRTVEIARKSEVQEKSRYSRKRDACRFVFSCYSVMKTDKYTKMKERQRDRASADVEKGKKKSNYDIFLDAIVETFNNDDSFDWSFPPHINSFDEQQMDDVGQLQKVDTENMKTIWAYINKFDKDVETGNSDS